MIQKTKDKIFDISQKWGKKIGLDLPYFVKNGFWILIRYFVIGVSGLMISISFTRLSSPDSYGRYQFVLSILSFLSILSLPGFNVVAVKEARRKNFGSIIKIVKYSFISSLLAVPIILFFGIYKIKSDGYLFGATIILSGFLFPLFYAPNTWYTYYEGQLLFRSSSIRIIINYLVVALFIVIALALKVNLFYLVLIYLGINIIFNLIFYLEVFKKVEKKSEKIDFGFGLRCTFQKLAYILSESAPAFIITWFFNYDFLAKYQVAYSLILIIVGLVSALSGTYLPLLFDKDKKLNYSKIVFQNLIIGLFLFVIFIIFLRLLFFIFYGQNYEVSFRLANIFSLSIIFIPLRLFIFNFFTSRDRNKLVVFSILISNMLAFVAFYLFRESGFVTSVSIYFYILNLLSIVPLLFYYFFHFRKNNLILM